MPTLLRIGSFRFHFYSNEGSEPPHIHVRCNEGEAKFWLIPVSLANNCGVSQQNLREIERLVFEHKLLFIEKYNEFHRN